MLLTFLLIEEPFILSKMYEFTSRLRRLMISGDSLYNVHIYIYNTDVRSYTGKENRKVINGEYSIQINSNNDKEIAQLVITSQTKN